MFRRKKKPRGPSSADLVLEKMASEAVDRRVEVRLKELVHLGMPTIAVHGSDGITPAKVVSYGDPHYGNPEPGERHYVERGRWYAQIGDKAILGDTAKDDELAKLLSPSMPIRLQYRGYASPTAAENAAKEWWETQENVKVKS